MVCKYSWSPVAQSLVAGYGCPNCSPTKRKSIMCIETGEIFKSIHQASNAKDIDRSTISNCCNGKMKTAGGYHWRFTD